MILPLLNNTCIILITVFGSLQSCTNNTAKETNIADKKYTDLVLPDSTDYLIAVSKDSVFERGHTHAFINSKGDTIIPFGKYSHCLTDTLKTYAIVYDRVHTNKVTVAIDRDENILFDVVFSDNWPDELHDGLFRVKRNGKIGYANNMGQIIIPCQFACAFWFENGRAKVAYHCTETTDKYEHTTAESDAWFYIDTTGKRVR